VAATQNTNCKTAKRKDWVNLVNSCLKFVQDSACAVVQPVHPQFAASATSRIPPTSDRPAECFIGKAKKKAWKILGQSHQTASPNLWTLQVDGAIPPQPRAFPWPNQQPYDAQAHTVDNLYHPHQDTKCGTRGDNNSEATEAKVADHTLDTCSSETQQHYQVSQLQNKRTQIAIP